MVPRLTGEKGYKLPEQILFNFLALFSTLKMPFLNKYSIYQMKATLSNALSKYNVAMGTKDVIYSSY